MTIDKEYIRKTESKTAVLMIHGILGTPRHFDCLISAFPQEWNIYNILLDGHGGTVEEFSNTSMKKWEKQIDFAVSELLKNHKKIFIVAHSLGTLLAIEQAVKERRIEKLFLLAVPIKLFVKPVALFSAFRIYLGKVPESDEKLVAMKNCCGIELSKNPLKYLGWIPRFLELFGKIGETRKIIKNLKTDCMIFQSFGDELVSKKSIKYLEEKTFASINVLEKSGHYYYEKKDFDYLLGEFKKFICEK